MKMVLDYNPTQSMMPGRDINPFLSTLLHGHLITPQLLLVTWIFMINVKYQTFSPRPYCPTSSPENEVRSQCESR